MTEAERVLAEVALKLHPEKGTHYDWEGARELTEPYLPKPEPDRLTAEPSDEAIDRAYEVIWRGGCPTTKSARAAIRAALKEEG